MPHKDYTGLEAQLYDIFRGGDEFDEVAFYVDAVCEKGGSCLDVGCGSGRVMLPLAIEGVPVTGVDASAAMVSACRRNLAEGGAEAEVIEADMVSLDLGRQFDWVIVPGASFQLLADRDDAERALARMRDHLAPGGTLALSLFTPWYEITHEALDGVWRLEKDEALEDGSRALCHTSNELDRCEQCMDVWHRFEIIDSAGKITDSEIKTSSLRWYGKYEIALLLKSVGFRSVEMLGDFGAEEANDGDVAMAVLASK